MGTAPPPLASVMPRGGGGSHTLGCVAEAAWPTLSGRTLPRGQ